MSKIKTAYATIDEVPEDLKQFHEVTDDGIFYDATGMKSAMKKERENAAKKAEEAEALKQKIAELTKNRQEPELPKNQPEPKQDNSEVEELRKALAIIQEERAKEKEENQKLKRQSQIKKAADSVGLRDEMIANYQSAIGQDEKGLFVRDVDGTPMINPHTGQRLSLAEHFESEKKAKPWAFKDVAQGSGFQAGTGLTGAQRRTQINASELNNLKKQKQEAIQAGDFKAIQSVEMQAAKLGAKI